MTDTLSCHVIEPHNQAQWTVIWLHGLGADGYDFAPIVEELALPEEPGIRFIFPHAPQRPVSINHGMMMRAWYDISFDGLNRQIDHNGVAQSVSSIEQLIDEQIKAGIDSQHILIAGFSQGGAITLTLARQATKKLAGFLALSTYLPSLETTNHHISINDQSPILMVHGTQDNVVPFSLGKQSYELLKQEGYAIQWQYFNMGHSVCWEEIQLIGQWLRKIMNDRKE